ncbi:MAG: DUF3035 domain-containing protein [Micropepsaceae bacterium]
MTTVLRKAAIVVAAAGIGLAGCTGVKESLGAAKQAPDETAITTRAPLVVPATFDLKNPQPGAPRPQDADVASAAQKVLGGPAKQTAATQGEQQLLAASGAEKADPTIRQELRSEVREQGKRKSYADGVLFWRGKRGDEGTPINASKEEQRLNASLPAKPVEDAPTIEKGASEPVVESKTKKEKEDNGWLDWF